MAEKKIEQSTQVVVGSELTHHDIIRNFRAVADDPTHPNAKDLYPNCQQHWQDIKREKEMARVLATPLKQG